MNVSGTYPGAGAIGATGIDDGLTRSFERVRTYLSSRAGIELNEQKMALVRARLTRRLRETGAPDFDTYLDLVEAPGGEEESIRMIDLLTTNKTSFFREGPHYAYLLEEVIPTWRAGQGPITIWSAGCSSGQEPYSIAMMLREQLPATRFRDVRILATDLSTEMVARTRAGSYGENDLDGLSPERLAKFFELGADGRRTVVPEIREKVHVARLNLMGDWPMQGPFDLILCCNVMIYFSAQTRGRLVGRYADLLAPGAHLFVGHSESLGGIEHRLDYVRPATYRKP
jgi:chemotaxis protein methyltransferase CheR